jgi:AcrR family transcriptional regulator
MLPAGEPRWRRRKADRPGEIIAAALEVFSERGFAATRLDDVAKRAGLSKGALYLYFETKEDLFRAVVGEAVGANLAHLEKAVQADLPFEQTLRAGLTLLANRLASDRRISGVVKLVIAESRAMPELARIWHDTVIARALNMINTLIRRAQDRGEVRAGDPRYFAMGVIGPMLLAMIWRETFEPVGALPVSVEALAAQHLDVVMEGMRP